MSREKFFTIKTLPMSLSPYPSQLQNSMRASLTLSGTKPALLPEPIYPILNPSGYDSGAGDV